MSFRSMPYHRSEILLSVAFDENITFSFWIHETASSIPNVTQPCENGTFWPGSPAGAISVFARGTSFPWNCFFFRVALMSSPIDGKSIDLRHCVEIHLNGFVRWNFASDNFKSNYFRKRLTRGFATSTGKSIISRAHLLWRFSARFAFERTALGTRTSSE